MAMVNDPVLWTMRNRYSSVPKTTQEKSSNFFQPMINLWPYRLLLFYGRME